LRISWNHVPASDITGQFFAAHPQP
jgi:hypothetical protein